MKFTAGRINCHNFCEKTSLRSLETGLDPDPEYSPLLQIPTLTSYLYFFKQSNLNSLKEFKRVRGSADQNTVR
jgi:hypothetical protein